MSRQFVVIVQKRTRARTHTQSHASLCHPYFKLCNVNLLCSLVANKSASTTFVALHCVVADISVELGFSTTDIYARYTLVGLIDVVLF